LTETFSKPRVQSQPKRTFLRDNLSREEQRWQSRL